jgi:CHAD domain-containing protein
VSVTASREVERKYEVGPVVALPDLAGLPGVETVAAAREELLEATYVDTADLRLRAAGITVRHRTGGADAGWHLKLPAGDDREELTVDGPGDQVPAALSALVRAQVRGRDLVPVVRLTTRRAVRRLAGRAGVVEVADDRVSGHVLPDGAAQVWREWEAELKAGDPALLDAVHDRLTRAGAEPSTFRPLLDRSQTEPVGEELRWLAHVLGAPRDAEVMLDRLRDLVAAQPPELVLGKVQARMDSFMTGRHTAAHDRLVTALDSDRYLSLLGALDGLVEAPPFLPAAHGPAATTLASLVRRTWRKLNRSMTAALKADLGPDQDALLHQVRKDAKRTRYAAEAVRPAFGGAAKRYAAAIEDLQETLGDFHDGVVTREVLRLLGTRGHLAGDNAFTVGRLHALEQVRAERAVSRWPKARRAVSRRQLRRWFDR